MDLVAQFFKLLFDATNQEFHPVNQWYPETFQTIITGLRTMGSGTTKDILKLLNWEENSPVNIPDYLDQRYEGKPHLSLYKLNDYPWSLPPGVEHWVLWIRGHQTSIEAFKLSDDDEGSLPAGYDSQERLEVLQDYVESCNLFGYYGVPEVRVNHFRWAERFHENDRLWRHETKKQTVNREEAEEAMRWVGRHTTSFIKKRFPEDQYEVLWNRNPASVRTVPYPEHIQSMSFLILNFMRKKVEKKSEINRG
ncbi:hypothetical protein BY996DRAFT_6409636 [Phakopsora pachyrhizi]|nr:hypothetical protein BY996DRAFT_6409636 [Phakopsora pachyrhizi]